MKIECKEMLGNWERGNIKIENENSPYDYLDLLSVDKKNAYASIFVEPLGNIGFYASNEDQLIKGLNRLFNEIPIDMDYIEAGHALMFYSRMIVAGAIDVERWKRKKWFYERKNRKNQDFAIEHNYLSDNVVRIISDVSFCEGMIGKVNEIVYTESKTIWVIDCTMFEENDIVTNIGPRRVETFVLNNREKIEDYFVSVNLKKDKERIIEEMKDYKNNYENKFSLKEYLDEKKNESAK